jgi:IstB-like ATP binding protein
MALQLDQTISEAAVKNRSFAETLESLIDCELQARNSRSIERRFRLSRLHARHSIDSFHFKHHKSRLELKPRILRLLDLEFILKGTSAIFIGNPGVGKTFLAKIIGWRACQANQRVLFTTAMDMLNHLLASQVDHSLIRKLRLFTEPALLIVDLCEVVSNVELSAGSPASWCSGGAPFHIYRGLQGFEPVKDGAVLTPRRVRAARNWLDPSDGLSFHLQIDLCVTARGRRTGVAEQMTDRREINAGFQQRHGRAVPHAVWMEPLLAQIRNVVSYALQALAKDVADAES